MLIVACVFSGTLILVRKNCCSRSKKTSNSIKNNKKKSDCPLKYAHCTNDYRYAIAISIRHGVCKSLFFSIFFFSYYSIPGYARSHWRSITAPSIKREHKLIGHLTRCLRNNYYYNIYKGTGGISNEQSATTTREDTTTIGIVYFRPLVVARLSS